MKYKYVNQWAENHTVEHFRESMKTILIRDLEEAGKTTQLDFDLNRVKATLEMWIAHEEDRKKRNPSERV